VGKNTILYETKKGNFEMNSVTTGCRTRSAVAIQEPFGALQKVAEGLQGFEL
jgi:hypothetical protein